MKAYELWDLRIVKLTEPGRGRAAPQGLVSPDDRNELNFGRRQPEDTDPVQQLKTAKVIPLLIDRCSFTQHSTGAVVSHVVSDEAVVVVTVRLERRQDGAPFSSHLKRDRAYLSLFFVLGIAVVNMYAEFRAIRRSNLR